MKTTDIMSARDVADYLRLHLFTVHKLARVGEMPAFKIGNDWRFRREALQKWIRDKEKKRGKDNNGKK